MSLKSILEAATGWAKNFINHILPSSRRVLEIASAIVNGFKNLDANNPDLLNAIVAVIPGTIDDVILAKIRQALPNIIVGLGFAKAETDKTPDQILADGIKFVKSLASQYQATHLASIWIHLANIFTDNGVSLPDLQKLQQTFYEQIGSTLVATPQCPAGQVWDGMQCVTAPIPPDPTHPKP